MAKLISIQGYVKNEKDKKVLGGITVTAVQEGTKVTQETDENGRYVLNLTPGRWRISTWAPGYQESETYYYNFTAKTDDIDFELREGYSISGLVIAQENSQPVLGIVINAETKIDNKKVEKQVLADYYGKYCFNDLQPGNWSVQGVQGEKRTQKKTIKLDSDVGNLNLILSREMTKRDWRWGIAFFLVLIILLGGLIWGYFTVHHLFPAQVEPELLAFSDQLTQVLNITGDAIAARQAASDAEANQDDDASMQLLRNAMTSLKESWEGISADIISIPAGQKGQILILINKAETAAAGDDPQDARLSIGALQNVVENNQSIYLWSEPPMNYLEVLFWSLAGILIHVLISSGYYLRKKQFYSEGIWMHVSHILTMPVLSLVVVFLISMIKLSIQIESSEVILNINDPRLLVAISFIIAVRPWDIIDFVKDTGRIIFKQIQDRFSGDGNDRDES